MTSFGTDYASDDVNGENKSKLKQMFQEVAGKSPTFNENTFLTFIKNHS